MDYFRPEQTNHGFGHNVVVGIAGGPDKRLDAHISEPLAAANRQVLNPSAAMVQDFASTIRQDRRVRAFTGSNTSANVTTTGARRPQSNIGRRSCR